MRYKIEIVMETENENYCNEIAKAVSDVLQAGAEESCTEILISKTV